MFRQGRLGFSSSRDGGRGARDDPEARQLLAALTVAQAEFEAARSYFNYVIEPDLVDYAILRLAAAERRYNYVLHQARSIGLYSADLPAEGPTRSRRF